MKFIFGAYMNARNFPNEAFLGIGRYVTYPLQIKYELLLAWDVVLVTHIPYL